MALDPKTIAQQGIAATPDLIAVQGLGDVDINAGVGTLPALTGSGNGRVIVTGLSAGDLPALVGTAAGAVTQQNVGGGDGGGGFVRFKPPKLVKTPRPKRLNVGKVVAFLPALEARAVGHYEVFSDKELEDFLELLKEVA